MKQMLFAAALMLAATAAQAQNYGTGSNTSTHYCWNMSRDSRAEPFVWTTTRVLQGRGRITQL